MLVVLGGLESCSPSTSPKSLHIPLGLCGTQLKTSRESRLREGDSRVAQGVPVMRARLGQDPNPQLSFLCSSGLDGVPQNFVP